MATVKKDRVIVKRINKTKSADISEHAIPAAYLNLGGKRALALDGRVWWDMGMAWWDMGVVWWDMGVV